MFLDRIACIALMQRIATDGVAWCVCLCVCWSRSWAVQKRLNRSRCRLDGRLGWAQETKC